MDKKKKEVEKYLKDREVDPLKREFNGLTDAEKKIIEEAIKRLLKEHKEVFKRLSNE